MLRAKPPDLTHDFLLVRAALLATCWPLMDSSSSLQLTLKLPPDWEYSLVALQCHCSDELESISGQQLPSSAALTRRKSMCQIRRFSLGA